jgi:hypothetical protein
MEIIKSENIELVDLNFDRYEGQLVKIAKGNTLSQFAMDTCVQEYKRIIDIVSHLKFCFNVVHIERENMQSDWCSRKEV